MSMDRACLVGALLVLPWGIAAQQTGSSVQLGVIQVPPCPPAADPEYGLVATKAIPIGGGPVYMASRQRSDLNALRGPKGEALRNVNRLCSMGSPQTGSRLIFIDNYM